MKKQENCAECGNRLIVSKARTECEDMCNECYKKLQDRVEYMSDRNNRMEVAEAAVFWANRIHHTNQKEADLRAFMACVMPEYPKHKLEKTIRQFNKVQDAIR